MCLLSLFEQIILFLTQVEGRYYQQMVNWIPRSIFHLRRYDLFSTLNRKNTISFFFVWPSTINSTFQSEHKEYDNKISLTHKKFSTEALCIPLSCNLTGAHVNSSLHIYGQLLYFFFLFYIFLLRFTPDKPKYTYLSGPMKRKV